MNMNGKADTPEGSATIQRDLRRLEDEANKNCRRFNKDKGQVLHTECNYVMQQWRAGNWVAWWAALLKGSCEFWWATSWAGACRTPSQQRETPLKGLLLTPTIANKKDMNTTVCTPILGLNVLFCDWKNPKSCFVNQNLIVIKPFIIGESDLTI